MTIFSKSPYKKIGQIAFILPYLLKYLSKINKNCIFGKLLLCAFHKYKFHLIPRRSEN